MTRRDRMFMGKGSTITRNFVVINKLGMHARPASLFVQTASRFKSEIMVKKGRENIDGKSILQLLMLAAAQGTTLTVSARGDDAVEALNAIEQLIANKFGEE